MNAGIIMVIDCFREEKEGIKKFAKKLVKILMNRRKNIK